jgi:hypothetical protein
MAMSSAIRRLMFVLVPTMNAGLVLAHPDERITGFTGPADDFRLSTSCPFVMRALPPLARMDPVFLHC